MRDREVMDPTNLTFYAVVCGTLAAVSPRVDALWVRAAMGIVIGLIASATLPYLKGFLGL